MRIAVNIVCAIIAVAVTAWVFVALEVFVLLGGTDHISVFLIEHSWIGIITIVVSAMALMRVFRVLQNHEKFF